MPTLAGQADHGHQPDEAHQDGVHQAVGGALPFGVDEEHRHVAAHPIALAGDIRQGLDHRLPDFDQGENHNW